MPTRSQSVLEARQNRSTRARLPSWTAMAFEERGAAMATPIQSRSNLPSKVAEVIKPPRGIWFVWVQTAQRFAGRIVQLTTGLRIGPLSTKHFTQFLNGPGLELSPGRLRLFTRDQKPW